MAETGAGTRTQVVANGIGVAIDGTTLLAATTVELEPGRALIVRGPNGSGKSTFLKIVAGLLAPTSGTISVGGLPVSKRRRDFRRRVASMIGLPPMAPDLTVRDHVRLVAATWYDEPVASDAAGVVMRGLGISDLAHRFPHELSSGQTQLFALAIVLARPFDLLVLDEPEQRLDAERLGLVGDLLGRRRDEGASLIIATHSSELAERVGDLEIDLRSAG